MEGKVNITLLDCAIRTIIWYVDVTIFSVIKMIAVPVNTCIELCLIKSAQSTMLSPVSIKSVLSITFEATVVQTCVKVLKYHVWILWPTAMTSISCINERQSLHTVVLENKFNCSLVLRRYDWVIGTTYDNDCPVH